MKITAKDIVCPACNSNAMVMGLRTGKIHVFGCLKCRNARGIYTKAKEAKEAWLKWRDAWSGK